MSEFLAGLVFVRAASDLSRELSSELVTLAPPYRTATGLHADARLPFGSIALAAGGPTLSCLARLTALSHRAPWAVPCLALPVERDSLKAQLLLVSELRDRLVIVHPAAGNGGRGGSADVAKVVAAVRRRPLPTPTTLARWVARRLASRELEAPLRHQFEEAIRGAPADGARSVASYSRLFSRYGRYTARDWRALARLCAHVASRIGGDGDAAGLPFRTASQYAARYLGVAYHVTAERLGWEWVLEAALRAARYVSSPPP